MVSWRPCRVALLIKALPTSPTRAPLPQSGSRASPKMTRLIARLSQAGGRCESDGIGRRHQLYKAVRGLANDQTLPIFLLCVAVDQMSPRKAGKDNRALVRAP